MNTTPTTNEATITILPLLLFICTGVFIVVTAAVDAPPALTLGIAAVGSLSILVAVIAAGRNR